MGDVDPHGGGGTGSGAGSPPGSRGGRAVQPFVSQFTNKLDAKGRVSVPASYRQALATQGIEGFYCLKSAGHRSLTGYGRSMLDALGEKLKAHHPGSRDYLVLATYASQATLLSFDDEGRVRLPDELIAYAGLKDRVLFNGAIDIFEIWDPEIFAPVLALRVEEMCTVLNLGSGA